MSRDRVIIVHLRRPNRSDPEEMRSDPFWEFGSFGITRCHGKNLMHPRNASYLSGARFAFAQGGHSGARLVYLSTPVEIVEYPGGIEAKWSPAEMPFRYVDAPVLVSNSRKSDFPVFEAALSNGARSTIEGKFSSAFRSRATFLDDAIASEIIRQYSALRKSATKSAIAGAYTDALPWSPPLVDSHREHSYHLFRDRILGREAVANGSKKFETLRLAHPNG